MNCTSHTPLSLSTPHASRFTCSCNVSRAETRSARDDSQQSLSRQVPLQIKCYVPAKAAKCRRWVDGPCAARHVVHTAPRLPLLKPFDATAARDLRGDRRNSLREAFHRRHFRSTRRGVHTGESTLGCSLFDGRLRNSPCASATLGAHVLRGRCLGLGGGFAALGCRGSRLEGEGEEEWGWGGGGGGYLLGAFGLLLAILDITDKGRGGRKGHTLVHAIRREAATARDTCARRC
jgi:hypothetical protein